MALFTAYRRVLATPGALLFSATGLVGRLPISMAGLGIVLLVQSGTGSYGVAGLVAATYMVANALCAILQGRLVDSWGQARVLTVLAVAFGLGITVLVVSAEAGWPRSTTYLAAALAGATLPPVGNSVRARWTHVLSGGPGLQTAFALESVVDEMVYMVGPILVTVLATLVDPVLGLATAAAAGTLGSLGFAAQRRTEPPPQPHRSTAGLRPAMPWRTVLPLGVVCAALGILFGSAEVSTVAFADEQGHKGYAGALLAVWALGSLVAGLVTGAVTWRRGSSYRVRLGAAGMACAMAPLALIGSLPLMGLFLLLGGFAIAPTLIATFSLTQEVVPASRLNEGMAIMQTGVVAGVAPGAALSGQVIDSSGASAAYLVALGAGTLAALAALAIPRGLPAARGPEALPGDELVATGDVAPEA